MRIPWIAIGVLSGALLSAALPAVQAGGSVSYKIDGKDFSFKNGRMEYYKDDGYVWLQAERTDMAADPSGLYDEPREMTVDISIQLATSEDKIVGLHEAASSDEIPVHFSWYEIVPTEDKKGKTIKGFMASLDSGKAGMILRFKIDAFGPPGSIVTGTFSGKLCDEDGRFHEVTDGVFSVPRVDTK